MVRSMMSRPNSIKKIITFESYRWLSAKNWSLVLSQRYINLGWHNKWLQENLLAWIWHNWMPNCPVGAFHASLMCFILLSRFTFFRIFLYQGWRQVISTLTWYPAWPPLWQQGWVGHSLYGIPGASFAKIRAWISNHINIINYGM